MVNSIIVEQESYREFIISIIKQISTFNKTISSQLQVPDSLNKHLFCRWYARPHNAFCCMYRSRLVYNIYIGQF